jgi:hypothetical protein
MAHDNTRSWQEIRRARPLNDPRDITLQRLMDAEVALYPRHERLGAPESLLADILDELEPETGEPVEDLYLATLTRYVVALGGRLEVRAVFGDEQTTLLVTPPRRVSPSKPA